ncbi:hypothetical protein ACI5KX_12210 [Erythrobacter sp. GH1-10]|uniref:hypothetical protein n=1 Tax=Erythrobacter sp. GH1-10 TaxID=3349334 RepID=UPI003877C562
MTLICCTSDCALNERVCVSNTLLSTTRLLFPLDQAETAILNASARKTDAQNEPAQANNFSAAAAARGADGSAARNAYNHFGANLDNSDPLSVAQAAVLFDIARAAANEVSDAVDRAVAIIASTAVVEHRTAAMQALSAANTGNAITIPSFRILLCIWAHSWPRMASTYA